MMSEPSRAAEQRRAAGHAAVALLHHAELVAAEHGQIAELLVLLALVLEHQQAGLHHLGDQAEVGQLARGAPDPELAVGGRPDAEVDAGAFDGRTEADEQVGVERQGTLERSSAGPCVAGGTIASETRGERPSSRRRLAQNAALTTAETMRASGARWAAVGRRSRGRSPRRRGRERRPALTRHPRVRADSWLRAS